ncbi:4-alpha-glucanotransferase [Streptomyces physcomitrii]|uniref:4-alpha-glucanotransferase n=1 Tax=Streptomyces physcomitrii TaxID=2724184 RepID=A0ABX1H5Q3_9ACTN|nr:4-alpha-glucanotransferase [Streptomyces physcomitrii]NKI42574.1 4-alpha-glucanotransferase [Streptomyces physcomitrii]
MPLSRLASLHGVATSYSPSPGRDVPVPESTVIAALAALGVDASTPGAVRRALAVREAEDRERLLPPTVVCWGTEEAGQAEALHRLPPGTRLRVTTKQGETRAETTGLPPGVHRLDAEAADGRRAEARLIVAPERAPAPHARTYGLLVQLYSLLSARSWGMGDLGDLAELASWAGRDLGAGFLQVNPLHAALPGAPSDPSPYRPSTRRFPDPVHLRIEDIPEYAQLRGEQRAAAEELLRRAAALREGVLGEGKLIDRDAVRELKEQALALVAAVPQGPGRRAAYCDYLALEGRALEDHATFCAFAEVHGSDWRGWPEELRDPRSTGTGRLRGELRDRVDFHCLLAWLTDCQLAAAQRAAREAGMAVGLVHDLAVGVHPSGSDTWAQQRYFAEGMSIGAPPDAFNARGQDWGLPPWRPDRLAESGYAPYRRLLRALLRHAGALRIDHVMGLFRLWWVPAGQPPTEGTYVRYDAEAMLAVLLLEAHRADALVIGEDLGTVEDGVRETLQRRGVLGTSVLWFERDYRGSGRPLAPEEWRADCLATATTHDLPPTAARLSGDHVRLRRELGLDGPESGGTTGHGDEAGPPATAAPAPPPDPAADAADANGEARAADSEARAADSEAQEAESEARADEEAQEAEATEVAQWLAVFARLGLLPAGAGDEEDEIRAVHRYLRRTPARLVGVWLPDAVGDRRPQNVPGTSDAYPNWRLPIADDQGRPVTLEELAASSRLYSLIDVFRSPEASPGPRSVPPDARVL